MIASNNTGDTMEVCFHCKFNLADWCWKIHSQTQINTCFVYGLQLILCFRCIQCCAQIHLHGNEFKPYVQMCNMRDRQMQQHLQKKRTILHFLREPMRFGILGLSTNQKAAFGTCHPPFLLRTHCSFFVKKNSECQE